MVTFFWSFFISSICLVSSLISPDISSIFCLLEAICSPIFFDSSSFVVLFSFSSVIFSVIFVSSLVVLASSSSRLFVVCILFSNVLIFVWVFPICLRCCFFSRVIDSIFSLFDRYFSSFLSSSRDCLSFVDASSASFCAFSHSIFFFFTISLKSLVVLRSHVGHFFSFSIFL